MSADRVPDPLDVGRHAGERPWDVAGGVEARERRYSYLHPSVSMLAHQGATTVALTMDNEMIVLGRGHVQCNECSKFVSVPSHYLPQHVDTVDVSCVFYVFKLTTQ